MKTSCSTHEQNQRFLIKFFVNFHVNCWYKPEKKFNFAKILAEILKKAHENY
jgi:hypothetical protein